MIPTKKLNNGLEIPTIGLGVWQAKGDEAVQAVEWAIEAGYRLIDSAKIYGNEREVGRAIRRSGVKREDLFVTTKLWNSDQGYESALRAFDVSLEALGLDYVDLYLIHWPISQFRTESWRALERIVSSGKCRAIGVANYTVEHLEELKKNSTIKPVVNQVEFHPFLYQKELLEYCQKNNIQLEAYSPLAHGERLSDVRIAAIAKKHEKSNAQIMLRWSIQHGTIVIPKSVKQARIKENLDVFDFELTDEDMQEMDSWNENFRTCWDPTDVKFA